MVCLGQSADQNMAESEYSSRINGDFINVGGHDGIAEGTLDDSGHYGVHHARPVKWTPIKAPLE
jgi:hypothetical protein